MLSLANLQLRKFQSMYFKQEEDDPTWKERIKSQESGKQVGESNE